jgi:hypothetical protein
MNLDHLSYVTSHDQLADTVQRLGSRLGTTFVDGGVHPRFGTRNFTAPLLGAKYIEVVCPLDHPASEQTPWGQAVARKAIEGGGWLTWVFSVDEISILEQKFERSAVEGHRTRPDGTDLKWKQIGVREILDTPEFPFFIEWLTTDHPSVDGTGVSKITKIIFLDAHKFADSWFKDEILSSLEGIEIEWRNSETQDGTSGILEVEFKTPTGVVRLD